LADLARAIIVGFVIVVWFVGLLSLTVLARILGREFLR
jgi:hypothetical protein